MIYENGVVAEKDINKSLLWYLKAANKNHALAQYNVGILYQKSMDVPKNSEIALKWIIQASNNNLPIAQFRLGTMYLTGAGIIEDKQKAAMLIKKSYDGGYLKAKEVLDEYKLWKIHKLKKTPTLEDWLMSGENLGDTIEPQL